MKILVYGNSGSGKSTYAKAMSARHGLAHLDLDSIVWEPGKIAVQRSPEAIAASLQDFMRGEARWVIEGCYGELVEAASHHCTQLVFLNPGCEACLANNLKRPWEPHKYASPEDQDAMLAQLQDWVRAYYTRDDQWSYKAHRRIFDDFAGAKNEYLSGAPMSSQFAGSCLCGSVRFVIEGSFDHFYLCHCSHCRKDSGSSNSANLFSSNAKLTWLGGQDRVATYRLPDTRHARSFCATCGSALPFSSTDLLVVPAGSLDTDIAMAPDGHIFTSRRARWDHDLEAAPSHPLFPA
ncbi:MAG TPA: GFA family protein [Arenimonas sp.]